MGFGREEWEREDIQPNPPPPPFGGYPTRCPVQVFTYPACKVFSHLIFFAVMFSSISYTPSYCPILPNATPSPLINVEFVIRILVLFAFVETLSSPLMIVMRSKWILLLYIVSTPSVFRAGLPLEEVLFM